MWNFDVDLPADSPLKGMWLVVKRNGKIAKVFGGPFLLSNNGTESFQITVVPSPVGNAMSAAESITVSWNEATLRDIPNPFRLQGGGLTLRNQSPSFYRNEAILASVRPGMGPHLTSGDALRDHDAMIASSTVLMLMLTESTNPPALEVK